MLRNFHNPKNIRNPVIFFKNHSCSCFCGSLILRISPMQAWFDSRYHSPCFTHAKTTRQSPMRQLIITQFRCFGKLFRNKGSVKLLWSFFLDKGQEIRSILPSARIARCVPLFPSNGVRSCSYMLQSYLWFRISSIIRSLYAL